MSFEIFQQLEANQSTMQLAIPGKLRTSYSANFLSNRSLRLISFSNNRSHAIPLFIALNILPVDMLYTETVATIIHDVFTNSTHKNIRQLFLTHLMSIHTIHVSLRQRNSTFRNLDWI